MYVHAGLSLRGFIEVIFVVARRRYPMSSLTESVQRLIVYCTAVIDDERRHSSSATLTFSTSFPASVPPSSVGLLPLIGDASRLELRDREPANFPSLDRSHAPPLNGGSSVPPAASTRSLPLVRASLSTSDAVRRCAAVDDAVGLEAVTDSPNKTSITTSGFSTSVTSAALGRKVLNGQPSTRLNTEFSKSAPAPAVDALDGGRSSDDVVVQKRKHHVGLRRMEMSGKLGGAFTAVHKAKDQ